MYVVDVCTCVARS